MRYAGAESTAVIEIETNSMTYSSFLPNKTGEYGFELMALSQ